MMRRTALAIMVLGVLLAACTGDSAPESIAIENQSDTEGSSTASTNPTGAEDQAIGGGSPDGVLTGRKIIRQASLVVEDDDPETVFEKIVALVERAGGFVAASDLQRTEDGEPPRIDLTLRLPSGSLTSTITAITSEVGEVLSRQLGSSDVTAQYVDIEARLRNLESLESELLLLLTEVRDVADPEARDLLLVFDRLQSVRLEIEQLVGQKQSIDDQVDLATLRITIVPTPPEIEITDDSWQPMERVRESLASLVDVLEGLGNLAIWAGVFLVPVLVLLAVPVGLFWGFLARRSRRAAAPTSNERVSVDMSSNPDTTDESEDG